MLMIIIGLTAAQSRAGIALAFVAGLSGLLLAWRHKRDGSGRRLLRFAIGANVVALLLAFQFGFVGFMQRAEHAEGMEELRWPVAQITSKAAIANLPFGSGFGTFVPVYDKFAPRTLLAEAFVNHAHNDWLELWLTGGVPAIILILGFLLWFGVATFGLWSRGQPEAPVLDLALAQAASIVIVLLLLHSVVEFPLRTPTLSVLFAIVCGFLIPRCRIERRVELPVGIERFARENVVRPRDRYHDL
jgi:O-antigen ligase